MKVSAMIADLSLVNNIQKLKPILKACTTEQLDEIQLYYASRLSVVEDLYLKTEYYFDKGHESRDSFEQVATEYADLKEIISFLTVIQSTHK